MNDQLIPVTGRALEVSGVAKSFGSTRALIDVDLDVADGELLALVGPSGCGKSTLLRVVAGLNAADRGEVRIGGRLVEDGSRRADPEQRDVGLVFQEHALFPHLTVSRNIMFGLRALSRPERQRRADHWLATIGLPGNGDRYPHELSGGERQRVALARALAPHPRLMLLDEPFASLDPNLRAQIRADVVHLLHETGTAAVFVTHDQAEALAIGDRIAVIRAGRIEQIGTPVDVFHHPANRFVAGFMGEARFLPIDPVTNMTELGPAAIRRREPTGDLLVVRPSDVRIHCKDAPSYAVEAKVVAAEFRGASRVYELSLPSGALVRCEQSHEVDLHLGDSVHVSLTPGYHAAVSDTGA
ncbi:MAG TPA: ABC transporter ATP-binding protein [Ilumatobacter sp.]